MTDRFHIGKIVNTHGLKGEVKIYPYTETPDHFISFSQLYLEGLEDRPFKICTARVHKGMVLVTLDGIHSIESAQALMQKDVFVARSEVPDDGEGHFVVDLLGFKIVNEAGMVLGTLKDVIQNTAQDVYEVERPEGGVFYIPVVDAFVKRIDMEEACIEVSLIEGMM